jgi:CheY-like chemotaxis protein
MKILVLDSKWINRKAAKEQLKDYDLTVVRTSEEAQKLLTPKIDYEKGLKWLRSQFGDFCPYHSSVDEKKKTEYFETEKKSKELATIYPNFDVVLSDIVLIGLLAAVRARTKYIAVFVDNDHRSHSVSDFFDSFYKAGESEPTTFTVEQSKFLINSSCWIGRFDPHNLSKALEYKDFKNRTDVVRAKNWREILDYLLLS